LFDSAASQEFAELEDDAKIYKLVGPVLLKQERAEAVMNVDKRLEFIQSEMYVPTELLVRLYANC
jgi:prefoldin beta subunit